MKSLLKFIATVALVFRFSSHAEAQSRVKAAQLEAESGLTEYNLGHFPEAVAHFERAYKIDPAPVFLFNIAQAHRQTGNYERALFFYRRYLEQAPKAANRADVERRMADLDEALARQQELNKKPPTELETASLPPAAGPAPPETPVPLPVQVDAKGEEQGDESDGHRRVRFLAQASVGFPKFGGVDIDRPTVLAVEASGLYAVRVGPVELDGGLALSWSPLGYRRVTAGSSESSYLFGALALGAVRKRIGDRFAARGHVGGGVTWWGGLGDDNPFTVEGVKPSGAIPMPTGRVGAAFEVRLTENLWAHVAPTFTFAKTTSPGLKQRVSSITRVDVGAGAAYWF